MFTITRPGKYALTLNVPVMPAAGTFGFGDAYGKLVEIEKLGAVITNPITYEPWSPASGTRVVPLDAGVLIHTGLPNPGVKAIIKKHREAWAKSPVPVIAHLVGTSPDQVRSAAGQLGGVEAVAAIELGLNDDIFWQDAVDLVKAAIEGTQKPILARLPMNQAYEFAAPVAEAGAGALVIAAPPRGTARDPQTGKLVGGRIYGPMIKPLVLRMVSQIRQEIDRAVPIIGAGGIHATEDARDYIEAGATAVQVDAVTWIQPKMLERIARDLSGLLVTRPSEAFPDEWHTGMGDTEFRSLFEDDPDAGS